MHVCLSVPVCTQHVMSSRFLCDVAGAWAFLLLTALVLSDEHLRHLSDFGGGGMGGGDSQKLSKREAGDNFCLPILDLIFTPLPHTPYPRSRLSQGSLQD